MHTGMKNSQLILEEGQVFEGFSPSSQQGTSFGEVVFTTGMTGYCESLTDPSYFGQILVFTYPLIGNYGVIDQGQWESKKIHARGVVISEACHNWKHHASNQSFLAWLEHQGVPLIAGVDTRLLTITLRSKGVMLGIIASTPISLPYKFQDPNEEDLVAQVSIKESLYYKPADATKKIIVVDCGIKENILRSLKKFPLILQQVPHDADYSEDSFDGVVLSNGPGDPKICKTTISVLRKVMKREKPIFGICLGAQILALAAGTDTYKLPFGHRGHNQPCIDTQTQKCFMTSQNHGYAINAANLPPDWEVNFTNLNDGSVEGIAHRCLPFFGVQFHPEASPGPTDTNWLFNKFYEDICNAQA